MVLDHGGEGDHSFVKRFRIFYFLFTSPQSYACPVYELGFAQGSLPNPWRMGVRPAVGSDFPTAVIIQLVTNQPKTAWRKSMGSNSALETWIKQSW